MLLCLSNIYNYLKISNEFFCKKINPFSSVTDTRRQGKAIEITEG